MAGGRERKRKSSGPLGGGGFGRGGVEKGASSSMAPRRKSTAAAVPVLMVPDTDSLDCDICYLPLKPPIFQCAVGHVVCSVCGDKLKDAGACHVCGVAIAGGYRRCHAMERVVESVHAPCPHAPYGCDAVPAYHAREDHLRACPHAPCRCPGESCGFIGSTTALLGHFAAAHSWPCTTKGRVGETLSISLRDGFNFLLLANHAGDGDRRGDTAGTAPRLLFLLNVAQERLGRAISVFCIHPHVDTTADDTAGGVDEGPLPSMQCSLVFSRYGDGLCRCHYQTSDFEVGRTDLANGLPSRHGCLQFVVPNTVLGGRTPVKARIVIN
ncbi:hypothetical protein BS78_09G049300 [Paspalum vaginatum]|nr:hypothetical protein BS78_09G049300 [Paspalum vaginatum]